MRSRFLVVALIISAAFNLGFVGTLVMRSLTNETEASPTPPCLPAATETSQRVSELSARLQRELEPLRARQADETRHLAGLIAADEPDRQAIDASLDRLAEIGRSIHGLVVETVLDQTELLPADQRALFCLHVHRRLCDPWAGCGSTACNAADHTEHPTTNPNETNKGDP